MTTKKEGFWTDWTAKDLIQFVGMVGTILLLFLNFKAETEKQIALTHYIDAQQQQDISEIRATLRRLEDKFDALENKTP